MKTPSSLKAFVVILTLALNIASCKKDNVNPVANPATVSAIKNMRIAFSSSKIYNDSLNYWFYLDSVRYLAMMHHCDDLYHSNDKVMMSNYNTMMSDGHMNGGMMGGSGNGMMGDSFLDCTINGNNSTLMITQLHQLHIHHPTH